VDLSPRPGAFGEPIVSPWAGTVVMAYTSESFGRFVLVKYEFPFPVSAHDLDGDVVTIESDTPIFVFFAHMTEQKVAAGQAVNPGTLLGTIGATGAADGAHLHMEARPRLAAGNPVDPMDLLIATVVGLRDQVIIA